MKFVKALIILLLILAPIALVIVVYFKMGMQIAAILGFIYVPLLALIIGRLIKNKTEYGQFLFIKQTQKTTETINSGFECPFCGARFSFKRLSCPDCGRALNK